MTKTQDIKELTKINRIVEPWLPISVERMAWTVTLRSGTKVTIACPLGAAVEIEKAGHQITAER
jgi:hypothetical protein